jgi:hypothetical protein
MTTPPLPATDAVAVAPGEPARHVAQIHRDVADENNPAYRFSRKRAQADSDEYGAHTVELLAVDPTEEISK